MDDLCLLKESLEKRNPVLFLGVGFSYKSLNGKGENVELASGLCNHLYNYFFTDESTNDDQKSVALSYKKNNDLKKRCELIRVLDKTDERNQFFVDYFSGCHIDIKDSRNKICDYPLKKIFTVNVINS